ncbi:MAG: hypothetical protein WC676_04340 [Candidatus Omnitrophota bacterium]
MIDASLVERVKEIAVPFLERLNVELVDLTVRSESGRVVLEILADKTSGGITLDECARLNRDIGEALENANFITSGYAVEVSSPGLDRPLKTAKDFLRVSNKKIHVFLSESVAGKIEYIGLVKGVQNDSLILDVGPCELSIMLSTINRAKQIINDF